MKQIAAALTGNKAGARMRNQRLRFRERFISYTMFQSNTTGACQFGHFYFEGQKKKTEKPSDSLCSHAFFFSWSHIGAVLRLQNKQFTQRQFCQGTANSYPV